MCCFWLEKVFCAPCNFNQNSLSTRKLYFLLNLGESFEYLGRNFNFEMDDKDHKVQIPSCLLDMLQRIDLFTNLPSNRLLLYNRWVLSKLYWLLTFTHLSKIWLIEDVDSVTARFVRRWLELPIGAILSGIILPQSKFCLNSSFHLPISYSVKMSSAVSLSLHPVIQLNHYGNLPVVQQYTV